MFGKKKLAKRSIVGTRISALAPRDGRYYPGTIQSQVSEDTITSSAVYIVRFDNGLTHHVKSRNIIGAGFQAISSINLKRGQKVFLTLNGREVSGAVLGHDRVADQVVVEVSTPSSEIFETTRRLEDIRLLESRKSARLVDQTDSGSGHLRLADFQTCGSSLSDSHSSHKKRVSSHVIDVPAVSHENNDRSRRQRRSSVEQADSEHSGDSQPEVVTMDETIAAMVLTSLSVSPSSPSVTSGQSKEPMEGHPHPETHLSSSVASSGFYSGHSERDDHSPPLPPLSESAPAAMRYEPQSLASDDDSSSGSGRLMIHEEKGDTLYRCTWRGCAHKTSTRNTIERHIRRIHFDRDSDLELTDNEEDFHYIEQEEDGAQFIQNMTRSFAAMQTSSPHEDQGSQQTPSRQTPALSQSYSSSNHQPLQHNYHHHHLHHHHEEHQHHHVQLHQHHHHHLEPAARSLESDLLVDSRGYEEPRHYDHDYQRKILTLASSVPANGTVFSATQSSSLPISIGEGQIQRSLSWHIPPISPGVLVSPPQRSTKLTPQERLYQHQAQSPKSNVAAAMTFKVTPHRRARSEVRKCRKVYGMENRDQWCTQCKWKKACTRFTD